MRMAFCIDCGAVFAFKGHLYCPRCGGTIRLKNVSFPQPAKKAYTGCAHCGVAPTVKYRNECPFCGWMRYSETPLPVCPVCNRRTRTVRIGGG